MATTPFDSGLYRDLFHDAEVGKLFTDSAEVRAMMLVQGALAKAQGKLGLIPEVSAAYLHRAAMEVQIDPLGMAAETGQSAVVVPALVKAFREAMNAPEHGQYLHWGATSQDIMETGLILRLRQVLALSEDRIKRLARSLGGLADKHADLPMAGRTYTQIATPTTFGAVVASWGSPMLRHLDRLADMRPRLLSVSLSGAAGTLSAMGATGPQVRAELAQALDLGDPQASWHSERDRICELAGWMALVLGSLGKIGEDLILMTQSGVNEVRLAQGGGSSTMPQKSNPVLPSLLVALARHGHGLNATLQGAALHRQQRDGAAWFTEWLTLPQLCMATARALTVACDLAEGLVPDTDRMAAGLDDGSGLIHAEALSFALARTMPRPQAQAEIKTLCQEIGTNGGNLIAEAQGLWPELEFDTGAMLGTAPSDARAFAASARKV